MKQFTRALMAGLLLFGVISCSDDNGSVKSSSSAESSSNGVSNPPQSTAIPFATPLATTPTGGGDGSGGVTTGCISGDGTGANGVFALTADGSGANRLTDTDGMTANGGGYTLSGGHIWSFGRDNSYSDKTILGGMDQGGSLQIMVQPQANPGGENLGAVSYCNTGANYSRLTMNVQLGKYKSGIFYPSDSHTFSAVSVDACSVATSFNVPTYVLSGTEFPDVVVNLVKSNGDCLSYGAGCNNPDPLVANTACWRTKVYIKMPSALSW